MEYWDLYDEKRKPLNKIHKRGEPLKENEYHIVVSIITINSKNQLLTTRRAPTKDVHPNLWEFTAGSAVSGETSEKAAERELFEETGIKTKPGELKKITCVKNTSKDRYSFVDIYVLKKDIDIKDLTMQPGETTEAKWISFNEFEIMAEKGEFADSCVKRFNYVKDLL